MSDVPHSLGHCSSGGWTGDTQLPLGLQRKQTEGPLYRQFEFQKCNRNIIASRKNIHKEMALGIRMTTRLSIITNSNSANSATATTSSPSPLRTHPHITHPNTQKHTRICTGSRRQSQSNDITTTSQHQQQHQQQHHQQHHQQHNQQHHQHHHQQHHHQQHHQHQQHYNNNSNSMIGPLSISTAHNIQSLEDSLSNFTHQLFTDTRDILTLLQQNHQSSKSNSKQQSQLTSSELHYHYQISLQFTNQLQERVHAIETNLIPLTDIALGSSTSDTQDRDSTAAAPTTPIAITTAEVARACQALHGHNAKSLIHLEEILSGYDGFIGPSIQSSRGDDHDEYNYSTGDYEYEENENEENEIEQYDEEEEMTRREFHIQESTFRFTPSISEEERMMNGLVGQPLNRLSEVDAETDGGTPTSLYSLCND